MLRRALCDRAQAPIPSPLAAAALVVEQLFVAPDLDGPPQLGVTVQRLTGD